MDDRPSVDGIYNSKDPLKRAQQTLEWLLCFVEELESDIKNLRFAMSEAQTEIRALKNGINIRR